MKIKKFENILFYVAVSTAIFGVALLVLSSFVSGPDLAYSGIDALLQGFLTLFTFNECSAPQILFFVLFANSVVCLLIWLIQLIRQKTGAASYIKLASILLCMVVIFTLLSGMFAAKIEVNDSIEVLYEGLTKHSGASAGKVVAILAVGSEYVSLMFSTLFAFSNFGFANVYGRDYKEFNLPEGGIK